MKRIAFDCETHLIRPGMLFPKLVCVSTSDGTTKDISLATLGVKKILEYLANPDIILIGHNVAFDLGVIVAEAISQGYDQHTIFKLVFEAYAADRIVDTMVRAMLVAIAEGKFQEVDGQRRGKQFGLAMLALVWLHEKLDKADTWRLHYAALDGVPLADWPVDAINYAIKDADITWRVDAGISSYAQTEGMSVSGEIPDEYRQVRAAWVLHLMAGWGVRIDEGMVKVVKANLEVQRKVSQTLMDQYGIFKKDKAGQYKLTKKGARQKDMKRLRELIAEGYTAQGEPAPLTDGGKTGLKKMIKTDADSARDSGNVAAMAFADGASAEKLLTTYIPILERGNNGMPVTSSPNVLVASGRTSWTNPNWQNPPKIGGVRECVVARPGTVLVGADLDTVELRALAQSCLEILGYSEMAAALQRGEDLHLALAAEIMGIDYASAKKRYDAGDPLVSDERQTAKQINFGLPGGMGAAKFAITCINGGTPLIKDPKASLGEHIQRARELREAWFKTWPEMRAYLAHAGEITGDFGECMIKQPWSGRIRGGLQYCSCANTYFQGRVADGTKLALWRVAYACYVDKTSILYGSRLILFLHDEIILECPEGLAHECGLELVRLLCGAVQSVIPSIPITSAAVITRRWQKGAKPLFIKGRLSPCKPHKDNTGKTKWIHDTGEYGEKSN